MRKTFHLALVMVCAVLFARSHAASADDIAAEINAQAGASFQHLFENISRPDAAPGSVVASPTKDRPKYYYFWVRDGALVMDSLLQVYTQSSNASQKQLIRKTLADYVVFSRRNQLTPNRSTDLGVQLGEPKFMPNGSRDDEDWGRPQNDGPAIRATTLTHLARILLREGQVNYVRQTLYDGKFPTNTVIKADLEYVSHHWQEPCTDLWEEITGHHFYTLMVQRRAMIEGAQLASSLGDAAAADFYQQQAQGIAAALTHFWNGQRKILVETLDQTSGIKKSGLDVAVILGALHGDAADGFLAPSNDMVLSTASALIDTFSALYPINANKTLGPAIGRYPEDFYNGGWGGDAGAWFLSTLAYAELCNKVRVEFEHAGHIKISALNLRFFNFVLGGQAPIKAGMVFQAGSKEFAGTIAALGRAGDAFFRRALVHRGADGSMSEQFNRQNGFMQSAENLSWSHASFLTATIARMTP